MPAAMTLNERALAIADEMAAEASALRIAVHRVAGARVIDCGIRAAGGLGAGLGLARVCLAGRAEVRLSSEDLAGVACLHVLVTADDPVPLCLGSQYAGWHVQAGKFSALGSGPMRALYGQETLYAKVAARESAPVAVGVLETRQIPDEAVVGWLCERLGLPAERLTLLVAPTASLAGAVQVAARSLETALHKLYELGFDLSQVVSGFGAAPLPPVGSDDFEAMGRTNDAILYGGRAVLWVNADDLRLGEVGPRVPSASSPDFGEPFAAVFENAGRDFYQIDPALFSPAHVVFHNLATGRTHRFGEVHAGVLARSFFGR